MKFHSLLLFLASIASLAAALSTSREFDWAESSARIVKKGQFYVFKYTDARDPAKRALVAGQIVQQGDKMDFDATQYDVFFRDNKFAQARAQSWTAPNKWDKKIKFVYKGKTDEGKFKQMEQWCKEYVDAHPEFDAKTNNYDTYVDELWKKAKK